jgi:hypothetical protein
MLTSPTELAARWTSGVTLPTHGLCQHEVDLLHKRELCCDRLERGAAVRIGSVPGCVESAKCGIEGTFILGGTCGPECIERCTVRLVQHDARLVDLAHDPRHPLCLQRIQCQMLDHVLDPWPWIGCVGPCHGGRGGERECKEKMMH